MSNYNSTGTGIPNSGIWDGNSSNEYRFVPNHDHNLDIGGNISIQPMFTYTNPNGDINILVDGEWVSMEQLYRQNQMLMKVLFAMWNMLSPYVPGNQGHEVARELAELKVRHYKENKECIPDDKKPKEEKLDNILEEVLFKIE